MISDSDDAILEIETAVRAPVEFRDAHVESVDYPDRMITVIVTPYDSPAEVEYRGQIWQEFFECTAFTEVAQSPHRVRVNRDHNRGRTVGKAVNFYPERREGLVSDIYIAKTPLGDETLALAADDCVSASAGFAVGAQKLDVRNRTRRITKAYMDHIAFVESPAYRDARVLAVRDDVPPPEFTPFPATPNLDLFTNDEILRWASERLNRK